MKKIIKWLIILVVSIALLYGGTVGYKGYKLYRETMDGIDIETVIKSYQDAENYVSIDLIPSSFLDAIVAVEDHRFMEHTGFDLVSFSRAVFRNVLEKEYAAGGSTITQQLAKNLFFSFDKKMERKVAELIVAKKIEGIYGKEKILELYVNIIYFGDGYVGIHDASMGYFGKSPSAMTDPEAILLAGLPQAPSAYALREHYEKAVVRSLSVIDAMVEHNYITEATGNELKELMNNIKIQVN